MANAANLVEFLSSQEKSLSSPRSVSTVSTESKKSGSSVTSQTSLESYGDEKAGLTGDLLFSNGHKPSLRRLKQKKSVKLSRKDREVLLNQLVRARIERLSLKKVRSVFAEAEQGSGGMSRIEKLSLKKVRSVVAGSEEAFGGLYKFGVGF